MTLLIIGGGAIADASHIPAALKALGTEQITKKLPEMNATSMAIYSQFSPIDISKNKEFLGFEPRYSVDKGMQITCDWLRWSDLN